VTVSAHPDTPTVTQETQAVLADHLHRRQAGDLEGDIRCNYDPNVVLLSAEGVHHGHEGVRTLATILRTYVSDGTYDYLDLLIEGEVGMLRWRATDEDVRLHDGVDSYVVHDGRIVAQTIHYSSGSRPATPP